MTLPRRGFLHLAGAGAALAALSPAAAAQTYPTRPVRFDRRLSRRRPERHPRAPVSHWLSERLGQPFVVENRPGGSGNIATEAVVRAPRRRLHAPAGRSGERDQRVALRQSRFQLPARHRAGRRHHPRAAGDAGAPVGSGKDRCRVHRLCQGRSGQDQAGVDRQRQLAARVGRAVQDADRRRRGCRALCRRRAGAESHGRRAGADDVRADVGGDRAHPDRPAARAGGDDRDALGGAARRPDRRPIPCRATRRARPPASALPRTPRPKSSTRSMRRSMRPLPMPP